jgi:hypothetical protein
MESRPIEATRLAAFLGDWMVKGTLTAGVQPAAISGKWRFVEAADGWGVRGEMETTIEGMGTFEENELLGFDPAEGKVHLFSINKFAVRDHAGDWIDETTLSVIYRGMQDGNEVTEQITIDFSEAGAMSAQVIEKAGGRVTITTELFMQRSR